MSHHLPVLPVSLGVELGGVDDELLALPPGVEEEEPLAPDVALPLIEPDAEPLAPVPLEAEGAVESVVVVVEEEALGVVVVDGVVVVVVVELGVVVVVEDEPLPEVPERSQPTTAAEARASAATTGMSLFMNFSNQDRLV